MTVWLSIKRQHITYHAAAGGEQSTLCHRWIGFLLDDGQPQNGFLLPRQEAVEKYQARPCPQCFEVTS